MAEQLKSGIVLVVEDDSLLRMFAVEMVQDAGFQAIEASNADEAFAILETRTDITILFSTLICRATAGINLRPF
jgi:DNA-binding response OmpR family regulator